MRYNLGFPEESNIRADIGTITHKSLELLAKRKFAEQKGETYFIDNDFGRLETELLSPSVASHLAYKHYIKLRSNHSWTQDKFEETDTLMWKILDYNEGMYNPLKMNIVSVETFFDFEIEDDWAVYDYKIAGKRLQGRLGMKGHIDLITKPYVPKTLEIVDYKTGQLKDWGTGKKKTDESLYHDPQLRMYHYAATKLYPEIDDILITIYYIRFNWMSTITFHKSDVKDTKEMIRRRFERIKRIREPRLIINNDKLNWKCFKLCSYNKPINDEGDTLCSKINNEILTLGIDKVTDKYCNVESLMRYGSGGGKDR